MVQLQSTAAAILVAMLVLDVDLVGAVRKGHKRRDPSSKERSRTRGAVKTTPEFAAAANAGMEHIKKGNVEDAIAALTEALDLSPGHPSAADLLYNRGSMYKKAGQLDAALDDYEQACSINPKDTGSVTARASLLKQQSRFEEALTHYDWAVELQPGGKQALYNRGNIYMKLERFEEAAGSFEAAVQIDKGFSKAIANLALSQKQLGRLKESEANFEAAKKINPDHVKIETKMAGPNGLEQRS